MWIMTYSKFKTIYFFFRKKKTFLKKGMKNGASYQTTTFSGQTQIISNPS